MPNVLVETKDRTTILTLNRPERRNALTIELMSELVAAVEQAGGDQSQRLLILRGAGQAFCAGLDLNETTIMERAHQSAGIVAKMLLAVSQTRLITIAQIHGAAVAGGAGLMTACDFVVAAERTKIGYPEAKRGLVAGLVMTFLRRQLRERDVRIRERHAPSREDDRPEPRHPRGGPEPGPPTSSAKPKRRAHARSSLRRPPTRSQHFATW